MNLTDIRTLYAYNLWANQRMFSTLDKLTDAQFTTPMQSSFPSIRESVLHILAAEWIWLKRWTASSPRATVSDTTASAMNSALCNGGVVVDRLSSLLGLREFADSIEQERQKYFATLDDEALHARLDYTDMSGKPFSMPLGELMQHVVNHGTYHRGQVTTLLRQASAETIGLDMVFFFRERQQSAAAD